MTTSDLLSIALQRAVLIGPIQCLGTVEYSVMKGIEHEVEVWSKLCRRLVLFFDGYWCKEVHGPGKFTLAFKTVKNALAFCTQVQQELWEADWDPVRIPSWTLTLGRLLIVSCIARAM